jgi:hypothetical protein
MKKIINVVTGEETIVELTAEEIAADLAEQEAIRLRNEETAEAEAAKATEKAALLAKLGITEDEARLLLG